MSTGVSRSGGAFNFAYSLACPCGFGGAACSLSLSGAGLSQGFPVGLTEGLAPTAPFYPTLRPCAASARDSATIPLAAASAYFSGYFSGSTVFTLCPVAGEPTTTASSSSSSGAAAAAAAPRGGGKPVAAGVYISFVVPPASALPRLATFTTCAANPTIDTHLAPLAWCPAGYRAPAASTIMDAPGGSDDTPGVGACSTLTMLPPGRAFSLSLALAGVPLSAPPPPTTTPATTPATSPPLTVLSSCGCWRGPSSASALGSCATPIPFTPIPSAAYIGLSAGSRPGSTGPFGASTIDVESIFTWEHRGRGALGGDGPNNHIISLTLSTANPSASPAKCPGPNSPTRTYFGVSTPTTPAVNILPGLTLTAFLGCLSGPGGYYAGVAAGSVEPGVVGGITYLPLTPGSKAENALWSSAAVGFYDPRAPVILPSTAGGGGSGDGGSLPPSSGGGALGVGAGASPAPPGALKNGVGVGRGLRAAAPLAFATASSDAPCLSLTLSGDQLGEVADAGFLSLCTGHVL